MSGRNFFLINPLRAKYLEVITLNYLKLVKASLDPSIHAIPRMKTMPENARFIIQCKTIMHRRSCSPPTQRDLNAVYYQVHTIPSS